MPQPLSFRWPADFVERLDAARGPIPRSTFVRHAVEQRIAADEPAQDLPERVERLESRVGRLERRRG